MKLIALFLSVVAGASSPVFATCFGYYCQGAIESITVTSNAAYIRLVGGDTGLTNCTAYEGAYFTLYKSNPSWSDHYAALLAAYHAKESITIRSTDASQNCTVEYIALP